MKFLLPALALLLLTQSFSLTAQNTGQGRNVDLPGAPANAPALLKTSENKKSFSLIYNGDVIMKGEFVNAPDITTNVKGQQAIEQGITLTFDKETTLKAYIYGSSEALAAETRGTAQQRFPLVRTSHGLSNNLRNNTIYDRNLDWMLKFPEGSVIRSFRNEDGTTSFEVTFTARKTDIIFRPRYYQKHKNIPYFQPWTYQIYKGSVTGWSSWWAYFREFTEKDLDALLAVWQEKHFDDYGYHFIQIDDGFQGEFDQGRKNSSKANGYLGGRPTTWLDWKIDLFPNGLTGYASSVNKAGFEPAIWMGCFFSDEETVQQHPDWFVSDASGKPKDAPWVSYVMDATNEETVKALIRPTFKGLKDAGMKYVKIDQLRHFLYDNLHNNIEWCKKKGITPDQVLRAYLTVAREELGDDTFILSCWGVLPESVGLADACRIGGDGYGPVTMQQYNSWNGIVWRNDPDHCDIFPNKKAGEVGNVKKTESVEAAPKETIIRPALASIAGAMLMLSDKPGVYADDNNLYGLRRSSPVLFSVPGQLYDFDPVKTDWLKDHERTEIKSGKSPSPIDADQFGKVSTFWLNEFNTYIGHWYVLHRLNWPQKHKKTLKPETIRFADLGLDPSKEYIVYEFWKNRMLGVFKDEFRTDELEVHGIESFAIREKLDRPQLVSTNRHLSQRAAELEKLLWEDSSIKGRSRVIVDDKYVMTFYVPDNYKFTGAKVNGAEAKTESDGNILKISWLPKKTESTGWELNFEKK